MIQSILSLVQEYQRLNAQYGFLSSLSFPKEYDRIDAAQVEALKKADEFTQEIDVLPKNLITVLEAIAADMDNGNLSPEAKLTFYTQDNFIEYLSSTMRHKEAERFKDMLQWMDEQSRAGYIETRFILEYENDRNERRQFFYDKRLSFVIVAVAE